MSPSKRNLHALTASELQEINRSLILDVVRRHGPLSRSQIAEELGLSPSAVRRLTGELLDRQLVCEAAQAPRGDRQGRPLGFNGAGQLVLGVDLGGTKIYGAVANLGGDVLHEIRFTHHETQADGSLAVLCTVIDQLLAYVRTTGLPLRGMGIGVPGIVQPATGVVTLAPAFNWADFPLQERLRVRYAGPMTIENDVNLAALGETWFGASAAETNLVLMTIGTGIGAGIIIDGAVYHGAHNMAGEVGYFLPDRSHLGQAFPGFGALEQLASGTGIAQRARQALQGARSPAELGALTAEDVFEAARRGEPWARPVLADTVDYLAQLIAAIALIFDPDVIVLGGGVSRSADLLIAPICRRLEGTLPVVPPIRATQLGYRAAILGAIVPFLQMPATGLGRGL